jgi:hypothetical protein
MSRRNPAKKPSDALYDAADVLREYVRIGRYRVGPSIGHGLAYLPEIKEAVRWLEYAAKRADEVLAEPGPSERSALRAYGRARDARPRRRR